MLRKTWLQGWAALYPMVTMNGEECHNEWEITHEEIHRNGIAFAIFNYHRFTGDYSYILKRIGSFSWLHASGIKSQLVQRQNQYVILGVTGPNEYENNINNNFYTNYIAKWLLIIPMSKFRKYRWNTVRRIIEKVKLTDAELQNGKK
jgi:maltose phosphorylase